MLGISLLTTSFSCADSSANNTSLKNDGDGFVVVELFTSEGCSSCPPADNAVARLLKQHNSNVYVLSYHVDYWNNLGWKDIFSSNAYTQIQKAYAKAFKLSSIYTPQVIVNGTEQFVGSDESKINAAVDKNLQQASSARLNINAKTTDGKTVNVNFSTGANNEHIKIALIQLSAENKIQRGENSGATLHHVNIVRDVKTVSASGKGNVVFIIPKELSAKDFHVIAFTQNAIDNKITSAAEASIQ